MTEIIQAFPTLAQKQPSERGDYQQFVSRGFAVPGISGMCHLQLEYYPIKDVAFDPARIHDARLETSVSLVHEDISLGEITFSFKVTAPNHITASPDVSVSHQGLGIGTQLLMLTDPLILHAMSTFPELQQMHVSVTITDQAGERTREAETGKDRRTRKKRDGWTSHIVLTQLQGFIEVTEPGTYPRTFLKQYS